MRHYIVLLAILITACTTTVEREEEKRYLIDWEQPENDENPVVVLVEP